MVNSNFFLHGDISFVCFCLFVCTNAAAKFFKPEHKIYSQKNKLCNGQERERERVKIGQPKRDSVDEEIE